MQISLTSQYEFALANLFKYVLIDEGYNLISEYGIGHLSKANWNYL